MTIDGQQRLSSLDHWRVVEEFRCALRDAFASNFKGLILYGSYARGDQDAESDIDLLVLFPDKSTADKARKKIGNLTYPLLDHHGALVSAMPMGELDYQKGRSPFFRNVKREGILILPHEAYEMKPEIEQLLETAHSSLNAAHDLFEGEYYGFAASRAYYAMFYAAEAALLSKGFTFSRHQAVIAAFGQHFAKEGVLPQELHGALISAFDQRNLGDYSTNPFEPETAEGVLLDAKEFLDAVGAYLEGAT